MDELEKKIKEKLIAVPEAKKALEEKVEKVKEKEKEKV